MASETMTKARHFKPRILIVDDEKDICDLLFRMLGKEGFNPIMAHDGKSALEMIRLGMPDLVITDVRMPKMDGMELLRHVQQISPSLPVILITGWGGIDGAVKAMKEGAFDYLPKPLNTPELMGKIRKALENKVPGRCETISAPKRTETISQLQHIMGPSEAVERIINDIELVGPSNFSVIVQGETGTGKERVARAIHEISLRSKAPLIPLDCGAIPETLFESELFGFEKGAFTGAVSGKPGKFELAEGGSLFLDEISNMPLNSQVKLLRAIQEKTFFRVGGTKPVCVDVRLIVASNKDLSTEARSGSFSRDLFYRLSEFTIVIPPLRERKKDILHIANLILQATNVELGKSVHGFAEPALKLILNNHWPGNVRQLRSVIRRAVLQARDYIDPNHLMLENLDSLEPDAEFRETEFEWEGRSLKEIVRLSTSQIERRALIEALRKTGGNKSKAARMLQIDYTTIHAKLKQYEIKTETLDKDEKDN
jgi:DNA-binding NtrC family response regulator